MISRRNFILAQLGRYYVTGTVESVGRKDTRAASTWLPGQAPGDIDFRSSLRGCAFRLGRKPHSKTRRRKMKAGILLSFRFDLLSDFQGLNMATPKPTEINLHKKSRVLEIAFDDGERFELPVEYLRCFSPSAEVQGHGPGQEVLQVGKENVNIEQIEQVGNYAITIHFDDGHNTGIYSWDTLYKLGKNKDENWAGYLKRLEEAGHQRQDPNA